MANTRSKIAFAAGAEDARLLAAEFAPTVDATDLQTLGRFEAIAHLLANDTVTDPVTIETLPPIVPSGNGSDIRDASRARHGRQVADVERDLAARLHDRDDQHERPSVGREP